MSLPSLYLLLTYLATEPARPLPSPISFGPKQTAPLSQDEPECVICHVQAISEPERRFGEGGQWVLGLRTNMQLQAFRISIDNTVIHDVTVSLALSSAYFSYNHMSVGGQIGYTHARTALRDPATNGLSAGPQIGYNWGLSPQVSIYPVLAVLYGYHSERPANMRATLRTHTLDCELDVAFVVALREHLSLSLGPYVKQSVYGHVPPSQFPGGSIAEASTVQSYYGLNVGLIGWL